MSINASKVLVSGDVNGHFDQLIKRVTNVCKKVRLFAFNAAISSLFQRKHSMREKRVWVK